MYPPSQPAAATIDPAEIAKFEQIAADWWNPDGALKPLHRLNPVRLAYIRDHTAARFSRDTRNAKPLAGLRMLDVGCGGGLLCEPLARLGAEVVGIDPAPANIEIARRHAEARGLSVDYRAVAAESLAEAGERFDVVLAMEVVEHVADRDAFVRTCSAQLQDPGLFFFSTINRTAKAYALAIIAAERLLRWLPPGTHHYEKLVTPAEMRAAIAGAGLEVLNLTGVTYNPLVDAWRTSSDLDVNYMGVAGTPAAERSP